jgi:hypothetical protein
LVDDLTPPLERLAWAQPDIVALVNGDRFVGRVAAPVHRTQHLAPEPDRVLPVGQVEHEGAGRQLRIDTEFGKFVG